MSSELAWIAAGCLAGTLTGLVPGLHVNTLAALALASLPLSPELGLAVVAAGTVHTFVGIVPATYLGAPGEETFLTALPAHRLLLEGRGPEAVGASALASLAAALAALCLVLPYRWLLLEPGRLLPWLQQATPWILGSVLGLLWLQAAARGLRAGTWTAITLAAAGGLGLVALNVPLHGLLVGAASPLLPLLTGLFGVPALLWTLGRPPAIPVQRPAKRGSVPMAAPLGRGLGAAAFTAVLPGLTSSVATAMAHPVRPVPPLRLVATLSVVNTAHAVLALPVLWLIGRPRTGVAQAVDRTFPVAPWDLAPSEGLLVVLAAVAAASAFGFVATVVCGAGAARLAPRVDGRVLSGVALACIVALVVLLTGFNGSILLTAAT
ncbi:MAG: tripartite tricarboxylate transporter permease, partial [Thermoplasmatota archaeon]